MAIHKIIDENMPPPLESRPKFIRVKYLCNEAVNITLEKVAMMDSQVTCKNCLRIMNR